jgi:hypothetical protein
MMKIYKIGVECCGFWLEASKVGAWERGKIVKGIKEFL